jgi:hypothetical protein
MVAVADPSQVFALLIAPLSTPYEGGGGGKGRLAGWQTGQLPLHLNPSLRRGSGEKGWLWQHSWKRHLHPMGAVQHSYVPTKISPLKQHVYC